MGVFADDLSSVHHSVTKTDCWLTLIPHFPIWSSKQYVFILKKATASEERVKGEL